MLSPQTLDELEQRANEASDEEPSVIVVSDGPCVIISASELAELVAAARAQQKTCTACGEMRVAHTSSPRCQVFEAP